MPDVDFFGLQGDEPAAADDPFSDEPEAPAAPAAPAPADPAAPTPPAPAPAPAATDPEPPPEPETDPLAADAPAPADPENPEDPAAPPAEPQRLAGRFETPEALEQGYQEIRNLQNRTAQENQQLRDLLTQAGALLQQQQAPATPAAPAELDPRMIAAAREAGLDEDQLRIAQALAGQEADRRVQTMQQQMQQQLTVQQQQQVAAGERAQAAQNIQAFKAANPTLSPVVEETMTEVFTEFDLEPRVADSFTIALEAATNPALRGVLRANPAFIDTDEGMALARQLATLRTPQAGPPGEDAARTAAAKAAHVERGGGGAPPASRGNDQPKDSWDAVLALAKAERQKSPLGI